MPRLEGATQLSDIRVAKEFSYMTSQSSGSGWVLVGDALGFIDPVYSSGVYFALEMGVRAGDAVIEGFEKADLSGGATGRVDSRIQRGCRLGTQTSPRLLQQTI